MWHYLAEQVLEEFVEAQRLGRSRRPLPDAFLVERSPNARRRAEYAREKRGWTVWYRMNLTRHRVNSRRRKEDAELYGRDRLLDHARHYQRRREEVRERTCRECGGPVALRGKMGQVPIYCSRKCAHRVASRTWWRRHRVRERAAECCICSRIFAPRNRLQLTCSPKCSRARERWRDRQYRVKRVAFIPGRWFITPHAVRRYLQRVDGSLSYEQALGQLIHASESARYSREYEPAIELWRGPRPRRLRFIVSRRLPGLPQLLTVYAGHGS